MGRGSTSKAPDYKGSQISYGNNNMGQIYIDPATGQIVTKYNASQTEQDRQSLVSQTISQLISGLGATNTAQAAKYEDAQKAYIDDATKKYLDQYDTSYRNLREDVASRFGSLTNSQFINGLNNLEKNKSSALADIINQGILLKYNLVNQEDQNNLQKLQSLSSILNNDRSNALDNLKLALSASALLNDYQLNQWLANNNKSNDKNSVLKSGLLGYLFGD